MESSEDLGTYDLWRFEELQIPDHSRLYHLQAIGIGTLLAESLTSYVTRLAIAHCVATGILMEREFTKYIQKSYGGANLHTIYHATAALNGTGSMATELVQMLEQLTLRNDLRFLTLLSWSELLPSRNLLRSHRAWCPVCYEHWHHSEEILYEPLLWSLQVVQVCPQHRQPLKQECPHCHKNNFVLAWRSRPGYCSKCEGWLGESTNDEPLEDIDSKIDWHVWIAKSVGQLISACPQLPSPSKERLVRNLLAYADFFTRGNIAAFARLLQMPKNTVWLWCKGKNFPSLMELLKVSYRLNTSIFDLLTSDCINTDFKKSASLLPIQSTSSKRRSPNFDAKSIRQQLEDLVEEDEEPSPSMREIAKRLNHHERTLSRNFPDLCRIISARHRHYRKSNQEATIKLCCQEVRRIAFKLHKEGERPTEARVSALISRPSFLRYRQVRSALQEACQELGL